MEVFGIIGMSLGTTGFVFGIICLNQMGKLIKTLKEKKILSPYELPKKVFCLDAFEYTQNGKLKREATTAKLVAHPY